MFIFNLATDSLPWTLVKRTKSPSKEKAERAAECQYSVCKLYFRQTASTMFKHIIVGLVSGRLNELNEWRVATMDRNLKCGRWATHELL